MGVHIKRKLCKLARELGDSELVIYMLDDVQVQYGDYPFWFRLLDPREFVNMGLRSKMRFLKVVEPIILVMTTIRIKRINIKLNLDAF
ncbi:hypothetical protein L916_00307 [Phytophthora nicotianae]|uniref:Uncharacterized protein n=1 Tax=Phytophthora nicotianae TaxID=4792 RepID=W2JXQ5_PHYNI|nr:hypothetical protein L916_00307 [Phytophthora nicotianae]